MSRSPVPFSDLRTAAYCPRKCYYQRTSDADREPPPEVEAIRDLATRYEALLAAPVATLESEPIAIVAVRYREHLERLAIDSQTAATGNAS